MMNSWPNPNTSEDDLRPPYPIQSGVRGRVVLRTSHSPGQPYEPCGKKCRRRRKRTRVASTIRATPKIPNTTNQNTHPLLPKASPPPLVATRSLVQDLFTRVRGREIFGSSYPMTCISLPQCDKRMANCPALRPIASTRYWSDE